MDGLSSAASVIAVIQLAGSIVKICGEYIKEVKNAKDGIRELQETVTDLAEVLQELKVFLQGPKGAKLSSSRTLDRSITKCCSTLRTLEVIIDPGKGKKVMRRLGLRALAWPLKRTEVEGFMSDLERYKSNFTLSLQIDQITVVTGIRETTDRIDRNMDLKQLPVARGAEFDSYTNQYEDYCLPGTREDLLRQVLEWARSPRGKCIFWLNGRAGTGKSTISRTVTKILQEVNLLGANFFFKRGEGDRGNATKLFPTIIRQLAKSIPQLIPSVQKAIHDNSGIATKGLKEQFDKILLQPLLGLDLSTLPIPIVVIVIDALDECDVDNDMRLILQLLPRLQEAEAVRLRVFLTSRPEWPIFQEFSKITRSRREDLILHQIPEPVIEHDISLFFKHRLSAIRMDHSLPVDWPGDVSVQNLVALSVPLFIFAATICRIFEDPQWDPMDSLYEILAHRNDGSKLDGTYLPVLNRLLNGQGEQQKKQLVQEYQEVIGAIVMLESPLSVISLSRLIGLPLRIFRLRLNQLHSVLIVPDDEALPVRIFHLSFRDFLLDPETREKSSFWVDEKDMHYRLATRCLLMCRNLRKNICGLPSDGTQRVDINQQTIDHCLPPELQYSCRYWAHHLMQCTDLQDLMHDALNFLQEHFLHWVEAMNLLGIGSEVVGTINLLQTGVGGDTHGAMSEFLYDAKRFILKNRQIADDAPLQLYCSGLIFAPQNAIIRRQFRTELPNWIFRLPKVEETWGLELQTLEGHSNPVSSVVFSPDGRLLASGSHDCTIRLWDTATGALQQTLEGHINPVSSVVFSPDGRLLASGSHDYTIRLWDTATGALQRTLKGPLYPISSVSFSPDGRLLASSAHDKIGSLAFGSSVGSVIHLWDTATGALQQTLKGHLDSISSVTFSPDGRLLASGSDDRTIRLWDTATGALQQNLQGHLCVSSVAFSPNGRLLASSAHDKIGSLASGLSVGSVIQLWDTATGALQQTLKGHLDPISSVTFSPDGRLLASGSDDRTIRLWDTATGALQQKLQGHSRVSSVAFSPDGRLLASGSYDKAIRLWDTAIGFLQQNLQGHSPVHSMAFSPNGRLLASGSHDWIVRIWDTETGVLQYTLEGHSDPIWSVTFSPDGRLLASGSHDRTVRIWDTETGSLQQTLEGHLDPVSSVAFSPDSRLLASGSDDRTIRLWDTATGILQYNLQDQSRVSSVAFSPDGQLLAAGSMDKNIRLWVIATGALQQTLKGHPYPVSSVSFSPGGWLLASCSDDSTVRLWDTAAGVLHEAMRVDGSVTDLEFSQDASYLATNLGSLGIQPRYGNHTSILPQANLGVMIHREQWITLDGEKVLWLPPEARASCSGIKGSTLVIGHVSGLFSFIGFRV